MKFADCVDDYIFSNQWVPDDEELNSIFVKTPGPLVILYRTSVLNGNKLWKGKMKET